MMLYWKSRALWKTTGLLLLCGAAIYLFRSETVQLNPLRPAGVPFAMMMPLIMAAISVSSLEGACPQADKHHTFVLRKAMRLHLTCLIVSCIVLCAITSKTSGLLIFPVQLGLLGFGFGSALISARLVGYTFAWVGPILLLILNILMPIGSRGNLLFLEVPGTASTWTFWTAGSPLMNMLAVLTFLIGLVTWVTAREYKKG